MGRASAGPHHEVAIVRRAHPPEANSPGVSLRRRLGPLAVEALSNATRRPSGQGA